MDTYYSTPRSSHEERQKILINILNVYESLTDAQKKILDLDPLVVRLLRNDELLWSQIDTSRAHTFSDN